MKTQYKTRRYALKDGKFYAFSGKFGVEVYRGFPAPLAWKKTYRKPWFCFRPSINLVPMGQNRDSYQQSLTNMAYTQYHREFLLCQFLEPTPDNIWQLLSMFSNRQWNLLALFSRVSPTLELAQHNPALTYCLASSWAFQKQPVVNHFRSLRSIVCRKQKEILNWLDWPKEAVSILRKIPPQYLEIKMMFYLRNALYTDRRMSKYFSHLNLINGEIVWLCSDPRLNTFITPSLLQEVSNEAKIRLLETNDRDVLNFTPIVSKIFNIIYFAESLTHSGLAVKLPPSFKCISQLNATYETLRRNPRFVVKNEINFPSDFPAPPLEGEECIIMPIKSPNALLNEAIEQRNCIFNFCDRICAGQIFVYKMLEPRATIAIEKIDDHWQFLQARTQCNGSINEQTKKIIINTWILTSQKKRPMELV